MNFREIRDYLERNNEPGLTPDELDHVAVCCDHITRWYYEDYPLGNFLTAIVKNDFTEAVLHADDINIRALKLYAWFLMWNLPEGWRTKGQGNIVRS